MDAEDDVSNEVGCQAIKVVFVATLYSAHSVVKLSLKECIGGCVELSSPKVGNGLLLSKSYRSSDWRVNYHIFHLGS